MLTVSTTGDFNKALDYLSNLNDPFKDRILIKYGEKGVKALAEATPVDSGLTRSSWYYQITKQNGKTRLEFCNSNINDYAVIAVILQYGHATGTGGWVEGRDYINPAIAPVFDQMVDEIWKEIG